MAVIVTALCLVAVPMTGQPVRQRDDHVSVSAVPPMWIRASSAPVAVLGINMWNDSGQQKLFKVSVNLTDFGSDGDFNASDLLPLGADPSSGVALFADNATAGSHGSFDGNDTLAPLASAPVWAGGAPAGVLRTTFATTGLPVPLTDLGNDSGPDFFVVVRTSARSSDGDDFNVSLASGDLSGSGGPLSFATMEAGPITVDALPPQAAAGPDASVDEGQAVQLSGRGSSDNNGIANFTWSFGDPLDSAQGYGENVSHSYLLPGRYTVVLNVTDAAGNWDEDTLAVTVRNINQAPFIISNPPSSAVQGKTYVYLMQASDPDGDMLTYSLSEGPPNMNVDAKLGLVEWTPGPGDVRTWTVALSVTDSKSAPVKQSYFIEVENLNDPPVFTNTSLPVLIALQGQPYSYEARAEDPDNNVQLVYSLLAGPRGMSISPYGGIVSWTPASDQVGPNRVVLGATDNQLWGYQDFFVTVTNLNDPPTITSEPVPTALQGALYRYQVEAFDPDGDTISFRLAAKPGNMAIDSTSGLISWVPTPDQVGIVFVRLEVSDRQGGVMPQSYYIDVANVNDPPAVTGTPPQSARQGVLWSYKVTAWDPDGDALQSTLLAGPEGMALNASSGTLEWLPGRHQVGRNPVALMVSDGLGGVAVQSFTLTVEDANDPPVAVGTIPPVAYRGMSYIALVRAMDPDGDEVNFSLVTPLSNLKIDRSTGVLVWDPVSPDAGDYHIAVRLSDINGSYTDAVFNVTVLPTNDPPVLRLPMVLRATVGERFQYRIPASDPNGDALVFTTDSRLFKVNATTGDVSFVPGDGAVGTHEFRVEVVDQGGLVATAAGVLVVSARPAGPELVRVAGYALAGLGGFHPLIVLAISLVIAAGVFADLALLRRQRLREEEAARELEQREKDGAEKEAMERASGPRSRTAIAGADRKAVPGSDRGGAADKGGKRTEAEGKEEGGPRTIEPERGTGAGAHSTAAGPAALGGAPGGSMAAGQSVLATAIGADAGAGGTAGPKTAVPPKQRDIKRLPGEGRCSLCAREVNYKSGADHYACSCGAQYHGKCFRRIGRCTQCGRGKDGSPT